MKFRITVILLLLSVVIFAQVEWEEDLQIRQGVNIEWFRSATTLDDGVVYVWSDTQQGGRDLFAQKVDVDGNLLWNDGQPLTVDEKVDRQEDPVVIATTDNSVVVAWVDFTNDENYSDIYVQKISSSGELMWQEGGVPICLADNIQIGLNIIPNDIGGAIVIWQDFRNTGGDDIFGASIDENGNNVWDENGNPLAAENGSQTGHTFWEDGNGGAVMAYVDKPAGGNDKNIKAKGIAADGSISWTTMICDYDDEGTSIIQSRVKSAKDNEGGFIFVWQDKRNIHTDLYGQRINIDGEIQWAENGIRITEMEGNDVNPRLCTSTENGVFISWELGVATESDLYITKINNSGENLWNNIVVSNNIAAQNNPRVSTEENGGVYVVWEDSRTEGNNIDIYAQHFDSDGIEIWETSGRAISAQLGDQKGNLGKVVDGNLLINWSDKRNGSVGLYFQIINNDGETILEEDGEQIFWGLSGNSEYLRTVRANDGLYFIWTDTRNGYLGSKIYVQKIDEEGNIYFDNNGILVCELFPGATQSDFFAIAHHDNGIVVSWSEQRETYPYVYYQHIDQEGNLFDNDGFMLTPEPVRDQSNSKIVRSGEDYYFYWEDMGVDWFACIYGQKIVNGERQWGDRGAPILLAEDNDIFLFDVVENYIIFTNDITQLGEIFVKAIDENGNALPGFPESGLEVCINNYPQSKAKGKIINGNLFVVWEDQRNGDSDIYGQIVTPQGDILWDENGIPLIDGVGDQVDVDFMDNEDMTIAWLDRSTGYADVGINKFDNDGLPMWAETFAVVKDSTQKAIDLKKIGSTSMIVYEDHIGADSNIYMQFVNNAGEIISDPYSESGLPLCSAPKNQYTPQVVNVDDNSAIVGWIDGRASGKEEIKGVFAQKVNIDENDTGDDYIPSPQSKLSNYPNPFNPTTNIYFSIDQEENVKLEVFNIKGQKINQLVNNQLSAGQHSIVWNGTDDSGKSVSSGVFFYKLTTESKSTINKMLMLK